VSGEVVKRVLEKLDHVGRQGDGWTARCPAHEDSQPSLSVAQGEDGRVLLHCHAACSTEKIVKALGLELGDLFAKGPTRAREPGSTSAGLTLARLAEAKRLPAEFLRSLGCADAPGPSVRIPYYDADRNVVAIRSRMALQGARFRWRSGDHVMLYGLERLTEVRAAGWVLLVEGESDCWTLWSCGIPALGIPGKSTWREAWASLLSGLEVFLWQEPDAADLADHVADDLPDVRVIIAPPETKDPSEAHIRGDDVRVLIDELKRGARSGQQINDERARNRVREAHRAAETVLADPDPLALVEAEIRAQGYGGNLRIPTLVYLNATTRLLPNRRGAMAAHTLFLGPSSSGKNAAMEAGLRLLPDNVVFTIDAGSARALIYDDRPFEHHVVAYGEADSLPAGEDNPAASAIRNLLQDGHLHYDVIVRDPASGEFVTRHVVKPGPTVLFTTSTRPLGDQLMTRLFTLEVPDDSVQLGAALEAMASLELDGAPPPDPALRAFQAYLQELAPIDVVVPFARQLSSYLRRRPQAPRVLRDYARLLSLIKAVAILRIAHRDRDGAGRIVATFDDYGAAYELVEETWAASADASERVRQAVAAVAELGSRTQGATVSITELALRLKVSVASAWRRVNSAIAGGWIVNEETRKRQTARLRVGEPLPPSAGLPSIEELRVACETVGHRDTEAPGPSMADVATSFVAASDSRDGSTSAEPDDHPADTHPSVSLENVQTPDTSIGTTPANVCTFSPATGRYTSDAGDPEQPKAAEWIDVERAEPTVEAMEEDEDDFAAPLTLWDLQ
jgi:hypothetical protein